MKAAKNLLFAAHADNVPLFILSAARAVLDEVLPYTISAGDSLFDTYTLQWYLKDLRCRMCPRRYSILNR